VESPETGPEAAGEACSRCSVVAQTLWLEDDSEMVDGGEWVSRDLWTMCLASQR
jgi:hypothetical protein